MSKTRKPKPSSFLLKDVARPPKEEPWIWHTLELKNSYAWRGRSVHCVKLIEFLEIEQLMHGGADNGALKATHEQLKHFGVSNNYVSRAIKEAKSLGLIRVIYGARRGYADSYANLFTLTYCGALEHCSLNGKCYALPTNEWKKTTDRNVCDIHHEIYGNKISMFKTYSIRV